MTMNLTRAQEYIINHVFQYVNICNDYSQIRQGDIYNELVDINNYYELGLTQNQLWDLTIKLFNAIQ